MAFLIGCHVMAETKEQDDSHQIDQKIELAEDWQTISQHADTTNSPIVVLLERSNCSYCEVVRNEFLNPLSRSKRYKKKIVFARISLDQGQQLVNRSGELTTSEQFAKQYGSNFTPTVLFLDGQGNQLAEKIIGMSGRDYYGYYLEQGIDKALASLNSTNSNKQD